MERSEFDQKYRKRLEKLATTNLSDALDKIGIRGAVIGIRPLFGIPKVVGPAVTIKITAAGLVRSKHHLGIEAIASSQKGDVIAIDNCGDTQNNCWGEILTCAAKMKGVSGVIIDGAARDVDACEEMGFPIFARGIVPITARGRVMQEDFNCLIRLGDVQRPGQQMRVNVQLARRHHERPVEQELRLQGSDDKRLFDAPIEELHLQGVAQALFVRVVALEIAHPGDEQKFARGLRRGERGELVQEP